MRFTRTTAGVAAGILLAGLGLAGASAAFAGDLGDPPVPEKPKVSLNLIDKKARGTLTISKHIGAWAGVDADGTQQNVTVPGLDGVEFTACLVGTGATPNVAIDLTTEPGWRQASAMTTAQAAANVLSGAGNCFTGTTKDGGQLVLEDLPLGLYYVTENLDTPERIAALGGADDLDSCTAVHGQWVSSTDTCVEGVDPITPYVVAIPMTDPAGEYWMYKIFTYPKNDEVRIIKEAEKQDVTIGDTIDYKITSDVPIRQLSEKCAADVEASGKLKVFTEYQITDSLDPKLRIDANTLVVKLVPPTGLNANSASALRLGVDYTVNIALDAGGREVVTITLLPGVSPDTGLNALNGVNTWDRQIVVTYTARALDSGTLRNAVVLNWDDDSVNDKDQPCLKPNPRERKDDETVYFGGVQLVKTQVGTEKRLANACFAVYLTEDDAWADVNRQKFDDNNDGVIQKTTSQFCEVDGVAKIGALDPGKADCVLATYPGATKVEWVTVENSTYVGATDSVTSACTDANGILYLSGLRYGDLVAGTNQPTPKDYWLAEISSPEGMSMLPGPVKFTVGGLANTGNIVLSGTLACTDVLFCQNVVDANGNIVRVVNVPKDAGFNIPLTGGLASILLTVLGALAVGGGIFYSMKSDKKKAKATA